MIWPPGVGKVLAPVGFKVVRVNVKTGVAEDFAVNKGKKNGPVSWLGKGGLERPADTKFDPAGKAKGAKPQMNTGVIWKITKEGL